MTSGRAESVRSQDRHLTAFGEAGVEIGARRSTEGAHVSVLYTGVGRKAPRVVVTVAAKGRAWSVLSRPDIDMD